MKIINSNSFYGNPFSLKFNNFFLNSFLFDVCRCKVQEPDLFQSVEEIDWSEDTPASGKRLAGRDQGMRL